MAEWTTEDREWLDLLRLIGLGGGLPEPLRTTVIEEGYEAISAHLAAHDAEVRREAAEKALRDAAEALLKLPDDSEYHYGVLVAREHLRARADRLAGGEQHG